MKPVLKFVKENLFVLICGVVAIVALALRFTWVGSIQDQTRTEMSARMEKAAQAVQLSSQNINLPNNPQLQDFKGAITEDVIKAKEDIQKWINSQAEEINRQAAVANQKDRINKKNIALLNGEPLEGFLPSIQGSRDTHTLKPKYDRVFDHWLASLLYDAKWQAGRNYDMEGSVPSPQDITAILARQAAVEAANAPKVWGQPVNPSAGAQSKTETDRRTLQILANKASSIRLYVNRGAFQIRGWYASPLAPKENQIFEGVFDCWLQQDVVRAINAINGNSRSVLTSPIKRLEKVSVGAEFANKAHGGQMSLAPSSGSQTPGVTAGNTPDGGTIFLTQTGAPAASGGGAPQGQQNQPQAAALDYNKSMTGRVGGEKWDVSMMNIVVHIDPSALNKFIAELYRQNNSYTVLDVKLESIDPYEAASNGYMYGNVPVVRADILVEALFFRNWTVYVVPESYRRVFRMPDPPAAEAAGKQAGL